jgi:hypothetical protein
MPFDERKDELGKSRGVYEGTPAEERGGQGPSPRGVFPGTPEQPGSEPRGESGGGDVAPDDDYGPLGWADVPGRPKPPVDKGKG